VAPCDAALAGLNTQLLSDFPGMNVAAPVQAKILKHEEVVEGRNVLVIGNNAAADVKKPRRS
jgi:hypothetical protein